MAEMSGDGFSNCQRLLAGDPHISDDPHSITTAFSLTADFIDTCCRDMADAARVKA